MTKPTFLDNVDLSMKGILKLLVIYNFIDTK